MKKHTRKPAPSLGRSATRNRSAQPKPAPKLDPPLIVDLNQRYTIEESLACLRISRGRLYAKVKDGEITLIKDGRRSYLAGRELARLSAPTNDNQAQAA